MSVVPGIYQIHIRLGEGLVLANKGSKVVCQSNKTTQKWNVQERDGHPGQYTFESMESPGNTLNMACGFIGDGGDLIVYSKENSDNSSFTLEDVGDGFFVLHPVHAPEYCLDFTWNPVSGKQWVNGIMMVTSRTRSSAISVSFLPTQVPFPLTGSSWWKP